MSANGSFTITVAKSTTKTGPLKHIILGGMIEKHLRIPASIEISGANE
jgi:hypothetical protein